MCGGMPVFGGVHVLGDVGHHVRCLLLLLCTDHHAGRAPSSPARQGGGGAQRPNGATHCQHGGAVLTIWCVNTV